MNNMGLIVNISSIYLIEQLEGNTSRHTAVSYKFN